VARRVCLSFTVRQLRKTTSRILGADKNYAVSGLASFENITRNVSTRLLEKLSENIMRSGSRL